MTSPCNQYIERLGHPGICMNCGAQLESADSETHVGVRIMRGVVPAPPPEPLLEVDEIKRRLAVYAVSIDGFDSLNEGQQELLTDIAIWVCRELERVRAISPSQEGVQGEGSAP